MVIVAIKLDARVKPIERQERTASAAYRVHVYAHVGLRRDLAV